MAGIGYRLRNCPIDWRTGSSLADARSRTASGFGHGYVRASSGAVALSKSTRLERVRRYR